LKLSLFDRAKDLLIGRHAVTALTGKITDSDGTDFHFFGGRNQGGLIRDELKRARRRERDPDQVRQGRQ
jgi:hypothetical protein